MQASFENGKNRKFRKSDLLLIPLTIIAAIIIIQEIPKRFFDDSDTLNAVANRKLQPKPNKIVTIPRKPLQKSD